MRWSVWHRAGRNHLRLTSWPGQDRRAQEVVEVGCRPHGAGFHLTPATRQRFIGMRYGHALTWPQTNACRFAGIARQAFDDVSISGTRLRSATPAQGERTSSRRARRCAFAARRRESTCCVCAPCVPTALGICSASRLLTWLSGQAPRRRCRFRRRRRGHAGFQMAYRYAKAA